MAIEGPVRELALSDLLQLLFLSRRTGDLIVTDEGTGQMVVLELEGGALAGATSTSPETRLGRLLVGSGRATDVQIDAALNRQRANPGGPRLGEILVETGSVRAAEVRRHIRLQVEEAVFDLMRWETGHLRFEERPSRAPGPIEIRLPTDIVLMDTARRLDEWAEVTATAPEPDPLPRLVASGRASGSPLSLQALEWEVLAKVDGENTLRRIARGLGRPELDVARAIYSLASAGVIEVASRPQAAPGTRHDHFEGDVHAVEEALGSGRLAEAERRLHTLLIGKPASAHLHVLRGRVLAARQDWAGAARTLERAIELDPLLPAAYFHLAGAAVRAGNFDRAESALAIYQRLPDSSELRRGTAARMAQGLDQLLTALAEATE
jgi:hypothetical protein